MRTKQATSPVADVVIGMLGLAAAMGVGRFAFTPLMPLMQAQSDLSLAQGASLAAANYAGYLAGALACVLADPRPGAAARAGLAGVALFTLAMGLTADCWARQRRRFWRCPGRASLHHKSPPHATHRRGRIASTSMHGG